MTNVREKAIKRTRNFSILVGLILILLIAGNSSLLQLLAAYVAMIFGSIVVYNSKQYRKDLIYLRFDKTLMASLLWAGIAGGAFFVLTRFFPGFSLGLPLVPNTITDTLQLALVVGFAPIVESIFFQSVVYGVLKNTFTKAIAFVGQGVIFSAAHVAAYVSGFYNFPDFVSGFTAAGAVIGSFLAAFIFAMVGMWILLRPRTNNLVFIIVFHGILNLIILTSLSIILAA